MYKAYVGVSLSAYTGDFNEHTLAAGFVCQGSYTCMDQASHSNHELNLCCVYEHLLIHRPYLE